jgi:ABC-type phosphate transport system substrate-binding protein
MVNLERPIALLLAMALALAPSAPAQEGSRVIVNSTNATSSLTEAELSRLFLKKTVAWPSGLTVTPVDQERTSDVRRAFSQKVHGKDADAVVSHWQTLVFSGRDTPPPIKGSDASVVEFVRANPGAVGYVSAGTDVTGVKTLQVR